jgi:hypothetical protein
MHLKIREIAYSKVLRQKFAKSQLDTFFSEFKEMALKVNLKPYDQ